MYVTASCSTDFDSFEPGFVDMNSMFDHAEAGESLAGEPVMHKDING